jgi:hypothetical protein
VRGVDGVVYGGVWGCALLHGKHIPARTSRGRGRKILYPRGNDIEVMIAYVMDVSTRGARAMCRNDRGSEGRLSPTTSY